MAADTGTFGEPGAAGGDVTRLLQDWSEGDTQAPERLLPLLYDEMRRIARGIAAGERPGHTLQPTAIVHEAWIQLIGPRGIQNSDFVWQSRGHFLGVAARAMRRVLVDYARHRKRVKRGGGLQREPLLESVAAVHDRDADVIDVHLALERLATFAPLEARVVELRYFGGLSLEDTAGCVGLSRRTVVRVWRRARAWLRAELGGGNGREA